MTLLCVSFVGINEFGLHHDANLRDASNRGIQVPTVDEQPQLRTSSSIHETIEAILYRYATRLNIDHDADIEWLANQIIVWSAAEELDPMEILAVIYTESRFRHLAQSSVGALGLMQMLPYVAQAQAIELELDWKIHTGIPRLQPWQQERRGPQSLFDPVVNLRLGIAYLGKLKRRFTNPDLYLAAYNMGPTLLTAKMRKGFWPHGNYSGNVYAALNQYRSAHNERLARKNLWKYADVAGMTLSQAPFLGTGLPEL